MPEAMDRMIARLTTEQRERVDAWLAAMRLHFPDAPWDELQLVEERGHFSTGDGWSRLLTTYRLERRVTSS